MTTVSFVVPVYNGEKYLASALETICEQTYRDFEAVVVDDGSTDKSAQILAEFATKDDRFVIITQENQGISRSLNAGVRAARGQYIARMDADDLCRPTRLEKQVAYMETHPDCVALGSAVQLIDPEGEPLMFMGLTRGHEAIDKAHLEGHGGTIIHPSVLLRREAVINAGGYAEDSYAEDLDLFLRLAEVGKLENVPDVLLDYRQHLQSFGYAKREKQRKSAEAAISQAYKRRGVEMPGTVTYDLTPVPLPAVHRKWAWWALSAGHSKTARKHAFSALRLSPLQVESWRVLACAVRGY